jgi:hypothetical protein
MYHGEKRCYNFESYISALNEQFQILNGLQRYGYSGINKASKVCCLNTGIKTDKLNAPKVQIMASWELENKFEEAVGLYQDFISQTRSQNDNGNINVSGFEAGGSGNGNEGDGRGKPHARNIQAEAVTLRTSITLPPSTPSSVMAKRPSSKP